MAALVDPYSIRRYLEGVGLPADVPTLAPARAPPQAELDFDFADEAEFDREFCDR